MRSLLRASAVFILWILIASTASADPADDYVHRLMGRNQIPGVALAVVHNGEVVKKITYGFANLEWKQPLTHTSPFWLDSLTKLITAVGVMQLVEQGKLVLDDPITKYLTDAPAAWRSVTVRHLLAHQSGINDDYWQQYQGSVLVRYEDKDIYAYAIKQPFEFKPGERSVYDNLGYYLLGVIIAKTTGERYAQWITDHVIRPAGMKTARMYNAWEIIPEMVSSYALKDGHVVHNRADILSDRGDAIAGWGLYASLDDMIAFDAALRGGRLVSPKSLEKMWSNSRLNNGIPALSGLGFSDVTYVRGHRSAFKGGQAGVNYTVFPDDGLSVILLANLEASSWSLSANKVASFFAPEIQPLSNLQIQTDPDPARTAKLRRAMDDIASGVSPSALLTPKMNASITPDFRAGTKQLLGSLSELKFLACEKPSPNDPYGTAQYCYYRAHVGDAVFDLGFGLARNGQLAAAMGQPE